MYIVSLFIPLREFTIDLGEATLYWLCSTQVEWQALRRNRLQFRQLISSGSHWVDQGSKVRLDKHYKKK